MKKENFEIIKLRINFPSSPSLEQPLILLSHNSQKANITTLKNLHPITV